MKKLAENQKLEEVEAEAQNKLAKSRMVELKSITPARDGVHKYKALFLQDSGRTKTVYFGAAGMSDYTKHKDPKRKELYLARHSGMGEDWNDPMTAGALSRWILWNLPSYQDSLADFRKRFGV